MWITNLWSLFSPHLDHVETQDVQVYISRKRTYRRIQNWSPFVSTWSRWGDNSDQRFYYLFHGCFLCYPQIPVPAVICAIRRYQQCLCGGELEVGRWWAGGLAVSMYIFLLCLWAGGHNQLIFGKYHRRYAGPPPNYTLCDQGITDSQNISQWLACVPPVLLLLFNLLDVHKIFPLP